MKKGLLRKIIVMAIAVMISSGACSIVSDAKMGGGSFVSISNGTVDSITYNGVKVDAVYTNRFNGYDSDGTYCCAAFVHRFYSQVFGRSVSNLWSTTSVPLIDQGSFTETNSPKVGDIIRDNVSVHWAIVKSVDGNTITAIQQNAWDYSYKKAWVGAKFDVNDSRYSFFTWSGNQGGGQSSGQSNGQSTQQQKAKQNFSIEYHSLETYETNAVPRAYVHNPGRVNVRTVGCYLWDENDQLLIRHTEGSDRSESRFNMWYDINSELGIVLEPGTTYKYQFFVEYDGEEYKGDVATLTTTGTKPMEDTAGQIVEDVQEVDYGRKNDLWEMIRSLFDF